MLNEDQIIKKLYNQAGIFKEHMMRKEYPEAVYARIACQW